MGQPRRRALRAAPAAGRAPAAAARPAALQALNPRRRRAPSRHARAARGAPLASEVEVGPSEAGGGIARRTGRARAPWVARRTTIRLQSSLRTGRLVCRLSRAHAPRRRRLQPSSPPRQVQHDHPSPLGGGGGHGAAAEAPRCAAASHPAAFKACRPRAARRGAPRPPCCAAVAREWGKWGCLARAVALRRPGVAAPRAGARCQRELSRGTHLALRGRRGPRGERAQRLRLRRARRARRGGGNAREHRHRRAGGRAGSAACARTSDWCTERPASIAAQRSAWPASIPPSPARPVLSAAEATDRSRSRNNTQAPPNPRFPHGARRTAHGARRTSSVRVHVRRFSSYG